MSDAMIIYALGFVIAAAIFGWLTKPATDRLMRGMVFSALWPISLAFVLIAGFSRALHDMKNGVEE